MNWERIFYSPYFLIISVALAFYANLWGVPLFDLDEGAFAEATREMLATGNYAATYLDGAPRFDKPILSYWFQALSVSLFGLNEWALRLPTALAATLWVYVVYRFASQFWDADSANTAVLIMTTTLWVTIVGRAAIADAWLNLFITLSILDIYRHYQRPQRKILLRIYVWLALGLLTKGPVAILIPLLTSGLFYLSHSKVREWLSALTDPIGWLIFASLIMPWLYLVYLDQGLAFFKGFVLEHNLHRFQETREGHGGKMWYYIVVLPLILLPFSGLLFNLFAHIRTLWSDTIARLFLIWFTVVFILVSVSQTQLPHYILYGITGVLMLFARYRETLFSGRWQMVFPLGFFLMMVILPDVVSLSAQKSHRLYEKALLEQGQHVFTSSFYLFALAAFVIVFVLTLLPRRYAIPRLLFTGSIQTVFVFFVLIGAVAELQQKPVKEAAEIARAYPDKSIVAYGIRMPSFSVYRQAITPHTLPQKGDLIFTRADRLAQLQEELNTSHFAVLYNQGGILLLEH